MEENKIEKNKIEEKKTNNLSIILTVVLCLVFGALGYYLGGRYAIVERDDNNSNNPGDNTVTPTDDNNNEELSFVGYYVHETEVDGEKGQDTLLLRDDNSFVYRIYDTGCGGEPYVGTYEVKGNQVLLTSTVRYGCDACFITNYLDNFTFNIKNDSTMVIDYNEYTKNNSFVETDWSKNRYVAHPVDGVTPESNSESWVDCTRGKK